MFQFKYTMKLFFSHNILLSIFIFATLFSHTKALNQSIPAILVFGDSIMDTGNNNNLKTIIKCNFPPYGEHFDGGLPTGRFCDGKVPSDIIAEELGIKKIVPPYLDPNLKPEDLITGVNFASGGTGYDPMTPHVVSVLSLSDQLNYFNEYVEKLKGIVGEERAKWIITNSLFLLVTGSNDIGNTYFVLGARKLQYDVPSYTDLMVTYASDFIKELHGVGARKIGVFSAPPVGCLPNQRTLLGGPQRNCAENSNQASILFNQKLSKQMDLLSTTLPNTRLVYIDVYTPILNIIQNPQKFGFSVIDKGCCGTGNIEVSILCNPSTTCSDVSEYFFWDSYHPTEKGYRAIITQIYDKYIKML